MPQPGVVWLWCIIGLALGAADRAAGTDRVQPARTREAAAARVDEIVVQFKEKTPPGRIRQINQHHQAALIHASSFARFHRLRVPPGQTAAQLIAAYQREPEVEYAERNGLAYALATPNDPLFAYQWNFANDTNGGIRAPLAWEITAGDPNVIIAVIDTGIAYEDYQYHGKSYALAPELSACRFVAGYDFVNNEPHANDDDGHGTHVAGTLAQNTNNGVGPAGLAYRGALMPVKVLNQRGAGDYATIAEGIYFAVEHGARVINMSLGGSIDSATLRNACAYAYGRGVTCVCAAGNEYQQGNPPSYPAAYDAWCLAVGAVRFDRSRAYYSNTGSYLDLAAPGGDVNVDQNGDGYADGILQQTFGANPTSFGYYFYEGTSMAAPHVSAAAALLIAQGAASPAAVRAALVNSAIPAGPPGWDPDYGGGILDVFGALMYLRRNGDLDGSGTVDAADLLTLAGHWLENAPTCDIAPPGGDGIIDLLDLASLGNNWE